MFSELDIERVEKVTKPKVQGSLHLEEIFHDIDLEFFVFFSSMASIVGNPGQSAYAAANMFMSGLATQRIPEEGRESVALGDAICMLADLDICKYLLQNNAVASAGSQIVKSGPISFAQSRFWFLQHFLESPVSALNITMAIDLRGTLNI
ncbi:KR-domain-containing protein [Colletotrichum sublineola]|nr:KR-domain-containing protein [Colletotrichum sublineola]